MATIGDRLRGAAAYGEEHGWCAGVERDAEGHVCIVGAIRAAYGMRPVVAGVMGPPMTAEDVEKKLAMGRALDYADAVALRRGTGWGGGILRPAANYSDTVARAGDRESLLREAAA